MSKISLKHSGGNVVSLNSPTSAPTSADVAFKLPNADGSASEALITDGSGNLSFASVAGGKILQLSSVTKTDTQSISANATPSDIVGNSLRGQFVIQDNEAKITVGISDDKEIEDEETLTFTLNGNGASVDVLIITDTDQSISDSDEGVGDDTSTVYESFTPPTVNTRNVITDDNGGIIEIPVENTGDAWAEPPIVFIAGEGVGATATGLLDENGFLTEIRVKSSGFGYKKNLASDNDVRCIIDAFSILSPGRGYTSAPTILVDGEEGRAEAIVKNGLLVQVRVLDRVTTYTEFPPITIRGGGGSGARLMPSLACLDTEALSKVGSTKIGTGRYVDCP